MKKMALQTLLSLLALLLISDGWAASQRYVTLVSDLHVGAGREPGGQWRAIEDFRWQSDFDKFLKAVDAKGGGKADLVLAGDVFEMWQSPFMKCSSDVKSPHCAIPDCHEADTEIGCTEPEAVARLTYILGQHKDFVASIKAFAERGDNHVYVIPGNHDAALLFDAVGKTLLGQISSDRVHLLWQGFWLSPDGNVYADHGHQFDDVNMFETWPKPFVERNGIRYMTKPWGENMVQQFYNQYENVFPIIDNLSDEKAGIGYAIKQVGLWATGEAMGKFLRFFLFQETFGQAATGLGRPDQPADPRALPIEWDYDKVRGMPPEFFLDVLPGTDPLTNKLRDAAKQQVLAFDPKTLTSAEIDSICAFKLSPPVGSNAGTTCPRKDDARMGALVKGAFVSRGTLMTKYLTTVLPKVKRDGQSPASLYVSGHTHSAELPVPLTLKDLPSGAKTIQYVNTGAFQRLASPQQIAEILKGRSGEGRSPLSLTPEDLPPCYTFVEIAPYVDNPVAVSMKWIKDSVGVGPWHAEAGTCF